MNQIDISLYAILDPNRSMGRSLPELAKAAAEGGATVFQYRDKNADTRTLVGNARAILDALKPYDLPLLINDRVDVALASGAHGVHLGQSDMHPKDARLILGAEAFIGLTIKEPIHVEEAPIELLDYVCLGGVHSTLSKDNPKEIGVAGWQQLAAPFRNMMPNLPVAAIAGIDASNAAEVLQAGADGVAVISSIFMQEDVTAATRNLKSVIKENRQ